MSLNSILVFIGMCQWMNAHGTAFFTVGTYNLDNYHISEPGLKRVAKSPQSRTQVRESILFMKADILALQEVGSLASLLELRSSLKQAGLDYAHCEYAQGHDTNTAVAILSRFPISARRSSTNLSFLLNGRRFHVNRAFAEVDIGITPQYKLTVINAHLKSRRPVVDSDESELRQQEAACLREIIDSRLIAQPRMNLVVLGDLNDTPDASSTRSIIGKGSKRLIDTRPAEPLPAQFTIPDSESPPRKVNWTYYYSKADTYSRIDYILISQGLAKEWIPEKSQVIAWPHWGFASDHRPVIAAFFNQDN